jgi:hypothetical protein
MVYSPGPWRLVGAAVPGTSHLNDGIFCQDVCAYQPFGQSLVLIALADGSGSAAHGGEGAYCAIETALASLAAGLETGLPETSGGWMALLQDVFLSARLGLEVLAENEDAPLRDFATTLICAVAGPGWLAAAGLGDGVLVALRKDGRLFTALLPQRGEYANETLFLTAASAIEQLNIYIAEEEIAALAVMSDGLTRLALEFPAMDPHRSFFDPVLSFAAQLEDQEVGVRRLAEYLSSDKVSARTSDDRSLVLAVRPGLLALAKPRMAAGGHYPPPFEQPPDI